ncbi:hypothetical protein KAW04_04000, partial [Candidatus Bathyarchaeota archaeon]|nr:hypothetical protein [Candidatus Bathyarchaeota archaeon]
MDLRLITFLMEFVSSFISLLVGYYALKGYKKFAIKELFLLYLGFIVLGVGTFLRVVSATYFVILLKTLEPMPNIRSLINLAGLIYTLTQLIAYSLFTATYILQAKAFGKRSLELGIISTAFFPIYRLFFNPSLELIAIAMLGFITVHSFINWMLKKTSESALVFFGFGFMLLSHLLFLFMILQET